MKVILTLFCRHIFQKKHNEMTFIVRWISPIIQTFTFKKKTKNKKTNKENKTYT